MRRLLSRTALLSLVAPALIVLPVATPSAASPEAVAPRVVETPLGGIDEQAADEEPAVRANRAPGARTVVLTGKRQTSPFRVAGVTWEHDPDLGELEVWLRTRDGGKWSAWESIDGADDAGPDAAELAAEGVRGGTAPAWVGRADGVQVRVDVLSGRAPRDLRLSLVDPGSSPADAPAAQPASTAHAHSVMPAIRTRAQWGADEALRSGKPSYASSVKAVTLHHTASSNSYSASDVPALIRGFYAYHVKSNGWSDIGYNVLVDRFGTAWEGRAGGLDRPVIGAHAGGYNTGTSGISMIGTYGTTTPSSAMVSTVAQVTGWKLDLHHVDPEGTTEVNGKRLATVFGHREVTATACPGERGQAALPSIRTQAKAYIQNNQVTGPTETTAAPASEPTELPMGPPAGPMGASGVTAGSVDLVVRAPDGSVDHHLWSTTAGRTAAGVVPGSIVGAPSSASRGTGSLAVFARGQNNQLYVTGREPSGSFAAWTSLGGQLTSSPAAAASPHGRLDAVARGKNGDVVRRWSSAPGSWSSWESLGGNLLPGTAPAVAWTTGGRYEVLAVGTDRRVYRKSWGPRTGWSGWRSLGGNVTTDLNVVATSGDAVTFAVRGQNGAAFVRTLTEKGDSGWVSLGGNIPGDPVPGGSRAGSRVDVFALGLDGLLYRRTHESGAWDTLWRRVY